MRRLVNNKTSLEGYTPVVTRSMRNRLRPQGIEALRGAYDGVGEAWHGNVEVPPPPGILQKSLQVIENTGRGSRKEAQETSRVCKSMGAKELAGWKRRERVVCRGNMR